MPRDQRLYMTFPIDIHRHPKLTRVSPAARWTFVEMNGEARIAENDGVFSRAEAEFMWPIEHLEELINSHPTRPLVERSRWKYKLRDYAEHQLTRADREELTNKRKAAGRKGGEANAKHLLSKKKQTEAESESESELLDLTDISNDTQSSHLLNRASNGLDLEHKARTAGITNLGNVTSTLRSIVGDLTPAGAIELAQAITARAKGEVRDVDAYVATACRKNPADVRWDYERLDLGAS